MGHPIDNIIVATDNINDAINSNKTVKKSISVSTTLDSIGDIIYAYDTGLW